MRMPLISVAIGAAIGAAIRLSMAHGQFSLFLNPFFPFFPSYFQ